MKVKVNPNRMELLRLRRRETLAQRGYRLLQDKLEKLIAEFHKLTREYKKISKEWQEALGEFFESFVILKIQTEKDKLKELLDSVLPLEFEISSERLLNLKLPRFSIKEKEEPSYSAKTTPCQWDRLREKRKEVLRLLFEVTQLYLDLRSAGEEILKTRRRVNALEYILMPQIEESIRFIDDKLTELEREFLSRLLRIKDLIRD